MSLITGYSDGNVSGQKKSFKDEIEIGSVKLRLHHISDLLSADMHSRLLHEITEQIDFIQPDHFEQIIEFLIG